MTYPNINYAWGSLIVEELIRNGVRYFCVAPGSRSSPLSIAIARHKKATTCVHFDERGLAFHALGYVTATKQPAVLVCTSGTAAANFLPAIVEASKKKLPLIVMTADRPPELRQTGAVQTIDQVGIFGKYTVWHTDMPCPDLAVPPQYVLTTIDQAVHQAVRRKGVVHINAMYREPLAPVDTKTVWGKYLDGIKSWEKSGQPYTTYAATSGNGSITDIKAIAARINAIKQGIIVAGKLGNAADELAVLAFAKKTGWPIFADISSGLRLGPIQAGVIHYFDHLLLSKTAKQLSVDGIVHFGGRMTSKRYYEFIQAQGPSEYVMVLNHALRSDPLHAVTMRVESGVAHFCQSISKLVTARTIAKYTTALLKANAAMDKAIDGFFNDATRLSEPNTARLIASLAPKNSGLFLSNSMPIRDMDWYAPAKGPSLYVAGNRGASGIDGIIASASGFAQGLQAPVTLMIGDVAALHDLNSLAMLKSIDKPLVIVVLNNGGGGIFSFLPVAAERDVFEKVFGTPHGYSFANAAGMFELNYVLAQDASMLRKGYDRAITSTTATIIEVMTSRDENVNVHAALKSLATAL